MKMKNVAISVVASLGLFAAAANAADTTSSTVSGGTVHFTGQIVAGACAVSTDTADQTVNLGQYTTSQISTTAGTTPIPFTIKLLNCSSTTYTKAAITFSGTTDSSNSSLLAVNAGGTNATAATGVGIQILDSASKAITLGSAGTAQTLLMSDNDENATNIFNFSAQYLGDGATVAAGQADADATFTITYS